MTQEFSITDEQMKKFEELLANKQKISESVSKQEAKFDAFSSLAGSSRVLFDLKTKLPFTFKGQVLVSCDSSNSKDVLLGLAKFVIQSNQKPVFVLMNYNYKTIQEALKADGVTADYIIVDTVAKGISLVTDKDNIIFVDSLRNLTQIQIKLINILEYNKNVSFIFDSLGVLNLYHEDEVVFKFIYSLTKILHKENANGFYISSKKTLAPKLAQFFDESIELKKYI